MERHEIYNKARQLAGVEMRSQILSPDWQMDGENWLVDEIADILQGVGIKYMPEIGALCDAILRQGHRKVERAVIIGPLELGTPGMN